MSSAVTLASRHPLSTRTLTITNTLTVHNTRISHRLRADNSTPAAASGWYRLRARLSLLCAGVLLTGVLCGQCLAAPPVAQSSGGDAALKAIAMEGLIIAASYAAAEQPRGFAVTTALIMPYAAAMDRASSSTTRWLGTIIAEGIAVYNYRVAKDNENADKDPNVEKVERDEIVRKNFVGWNIFAIAVGLSEHFTNSKASKSNLTYHVLPTSDGQTLQLSYRF